MFVVSDYDLFREVTRQPDLYSSRYVNLAATTPPVAARRLIPEQFDPPDHNEYRQLLNPRLSASAVKATEPRIRDVCRELAMGAQRLHRIDFVKEVARRLPGTIFLELLGLPTPQLTRVTATTWELTHLTDSSDPAGTRRQQANRTLSTIIEDLVAARRRQPRDDLPSDLLAAELQGRPLRDDEVVDMLFLVLLAGLDAVAALLTYAVHYLAQHPDDQQLLRDSPDVIHNATEELLRCFASAPVSRVATRATSLAGCPIAEDDRLYLNVVMANHDSHAFEEPDLVKFDRQPNRHVAFGFGIHHCLGSHLARAEIRIFLEEWHRHISDYRIPEGAEVVDSPLGVAAFESLPLELATH